MWVFSNPTFSDIILIVRISPGKRSYTTEMRKHYKSGLLTLEFQLLNTDLHITIYGGKKERKHGCGFSCRKAMEFGTGV